MASNDLQEKLDLLAARFGVDQQFTKKFFNDFEFAQAELAKTGLRIGPELYSVYQRLQDSYQRLSSLGVNSATYKKNWERSAYKKSNHGYRTSILTWTVITGSLAGVAIYLALKRFSKA
jgi:hypothetical protein